MSQYTPAGPTGPGVDPTTSQPYPAPAKKKSWFARHKVLTALGGIVVLVVVIAIATGGGGQPSDTAQPVAGAASTATATTDAGQPPAETAETTPAEPSTQATTDAAPATGIGTPVRDGKFEFTVTQVETGVGHVGSDAFGVDAQGQFVLLHLTVTNIGDEAQYFDGSSQKLHDTAGRTHSADTEAAIYLDDANSLLNQINPGNTAEGVVVFDVPTDAVPATAELHDSPFSGGVTVTLG
jgi:hypothetical protein